MDFDLTTGTAILERTLMAKQCREAIGPWQAYLTIMDR
jgi:hypothetical protein